MNDRQAEIRRARLLLILLTGIWGSTFVVLDMAVEVLSPFVLVASRFALAALALALWSPRSVAQGIRIIPSTLPLSLSMLAGFSMQTMGIGATTPARSAFLTSLSVVFVPVLDMFDSKRLPRWRLMLAAAVAASGVWVLFHPIGGEWTRGDTLTLGCAAVFAFYIVELDRQTRRHGPEALVMAQSLTIAVLAAICSPFFETFRFVPGTTSFLAIAYLGLVCTAFTFVLMTWSQARVGAVVAAVIYTLEPVVAALFSVGLGRDPFEWKMPVGGALVVAAMLVASTDPSEPHPVAPPEGID